MEKFPIITSGQFAVLFLDRNTGQVYDMHLKLYQNTDNTQTGYVVFKSLQEAKLYADQKITEVKKDRVNFGYIIYDHQQNLALDRDSGRD